MSSKYDPQRIFNHRRTRVQQKGMVRRVKFQDNTSPRVDQPLLDHYWKVLQEYNYPPKIYLNEQIYKPFNFVTDMYVKKGSVITPIIPPGWDIPYGPLNPDETPGEPSNPEDPFPTEYDPDDPIPPYPYNPTEEEDITEGGTDIPIDIPEEYQEYINNRPEYIVFQGSEFGCCYTSYVHTNQRVEIAQIILKGTTALGYNISCSQGPAGKANSYYWHTGHNRKLEVGSASYTFYFINVPFKDHPEINIKILCYMDSAGYWHASSLTDIMIDTPRPFDSPSNSQEWFITMGDQISPSDYYKYFLTVYGNISLQLRVKAGPGKFVVAYISGGFSWKSLDRKPYQIARLPQFWEAYGIGSI